MNEPVPVQDGAGAAIPQRSAALSVRGVCFSYSGQNRRALSDVSFEIPAGKTVALVGLATLKLR